MTRRHTCQRVTVLCGSGQHSQRVCIPCTPSITSCDDCRPKIVPGHTCKSSEKFVCKSGKHHWYQCLTCYPKPKGCHSCPLVRPRRRSRQVYVIKRHVLPGILQGVASAVEGVRGRSATHWAVVIGAPRDPKAIRFELTKRYFRNSAASTYAWARDKKGSFKISSENLGGSTWLTNTQIGLIVREILEERPFYKRYTSDCQNFAVDLLVRIVDCPSPQLCHEDDKRARLRWLEEMKQKEEEGQSDWEYDESESEFEESDSELEESDSEFEESDSGYNRPARGKTDQTRITTNRTNRRD